jgi:hypothetical protein
LRVYDGLDPEAGGNARQKPGFLPTGLGGGYIPWEKLSVSIGVNLGQAGEERSEACTRGREQRYLL